MRKLLQIPSILSPVFALIAGCESGQSGRPVVVDQTHDVPISKPFISEQSEPYSQRYVYVEHDAATQPASQLVETAQVASQVSPQPTIPLPAPQPVIAPPPAPQPVASPEPAPLINVTSPSTVLQSELPKDATVDQVLDALDQRGKSMQGFVAKVSMTDGEPLQGDVSTHAGQVRFQKISEDDGRLRVTFDRRIEGTITRVEKTEYLLDKGWLIDRDYRKTTQSNRQVVKPGGKMNLLKLGEGPFPLPIGQNKEDVHKLFDVTEIPLALDESKDKDLSGTIHLSLSPKPSTRFSRRFAAIDVWVDRKSNFPVQIHTEAPDGSDPHVTKLQDVQINPAGGLKDADFKLPEIDEQAWSLHTEPYKE